MCKELIAGCHNVNHNVSQTTKCHPLIKMSPGFQNASKKTECQLDKKMLAKYQNAKRLKNVARILKC